MLEVLILGNLGRDAEVKRINGRDYAVFSVCHSSKYTDQQGIAHDLTQWVSCYRPMPCNVLPYLKKGVGVLVRGELSVKSATDKGKTYINVNCSATLIRLQYSPNNENNTPKNNTPQPPQPLTDDPPSDDLPF